MQTRLIVSIIVKAKRYAKGTNIVPVIDRYFTYGSLHSGSRSCDKSDSSKMSSVIQKLTVSMNW